MTSAPLGYLTSDGMRAGAILPLTWFMLCVSILVCLIVAALLWLAMRRARAGDAARIAVSEVGDGLRWITIGLVLTSIPLAITLVWTVAALARVVGPPPGVALTLDVTGHQYWWEIAYDGTRSQDRFVTANEIHIPVGVKVLVRLHGADVIHSFWVPALSGKTDAIPGQTNLAWLEADRPGIYRGQCTEYCGLQHAKMGFEVVAEPLAVFERWRAAQAQSAAAAETAGQQRGQAVFQTHCAACHTIRGTAANGGKGPDLTHLMSRRLIAAATLPNNPGALAGWIENPQASKPGVLMPDQHLSGQQLSDVGAYLAGLK